MSINTCYRLFMENPKAIALLSLPENYQKEDNTLSGSCEQLDTKNILGTDIPAHAVYAPTRRLPYPTGFSSDLTNEDSPPSFRFRD